MRQRKFTHIAAVSAVMFCLGSITAQAEVDCDNPPPNYTESDLKAPMRFFTPEANVCFGNAVNFPYLAVGIITADTPDAFVEFAKKHSPDAPIELTSPGGNVLAALKLGELIRNGGYDTSLGELCASACTYAIMGGVRRYVVRKEFTVDSDYDNGNVGATGTKLGIHQFYNNDALNEPQKKAFSAIDQSLQQLLMGILLEYTLRMGIDTRLVSVASTIPPWEDMRWLTPEEMIAWNIDNTRRRYTDVALHAFGRSGAYVEVENVRGTDVSYLRLFCQNNVREPLFTFITDVQVPSDRDTKAQIKWALDYVRDLLDHLNISVEFGSDVRPADKFQVHDLQGLRRERTAFAFLRSCDQSASCVKTPRSSLVSASKTTACLLAPIGRFRILSNSKYAVIAG